MGARDRDRDGAMVIAIKASDTTLHMHILVRDLESLQARQEAVCGN